jgi:uncharacterized protein (DUF924 family)
MEPDIIIEFWFGRALDSVEAAVKQSKFWYRSNPRVDAEIREKFGLALEEVLTEKPEKLAASAQTALAAVVLLDQFSRNIFRGTSEAYKGDELALQIARLAVHSEVDQELPAIQQIFLYHPFHHSEKLEDQQSAVELMQGVENRATPEWREFIHGFVQFAKGHRDLVNQFGRFPHRNKILGRKNTAAEQRFLDGGARSYGQ